MGQAERERQQPAEERKGRKDAGGEGVFYRHSCSHGGQKFLSPSVLPCHCPILLLLRLQDTTHDTFVRGGLTTSHF